MKKKDDNLGIELTAEDVEKKYTRKQILRVAPKTDIKRHLVSIADGDHLEHIIQEFVEQGYDRENVIIDIDIDPWAHCTTIQALASKKIEIPEEERYQNGLNIRFKNEWDRLVKNAKQRKKKDDERKEYERLKKKFEG